MPASTALADPAQPRTGARPGDAVHRISARDLNAATPFVIRAPGRYVLDDDVRWAPSDPDARAITIAADHVTLDLNAKTLQQVDPPAPREHRDPATRTYRGDVVSGNVGIWAEGRRGLCIRNGRVRGVQGVGIALKDCTTVDLLGLDVRECGGHGVVDTSFLYRNGGLFVMGTKDTSGTIRYASDIRLRDCVCSANTSALDYVVTLGALILFCEQVEVQHCAFHETANTSPQPSGVQFNVVGIDFVICRDVQVQDCEAHDNTSGGEPAGFFAWGENYRFMRCRAHRNFTRHGNRACGFNISTTDGLEMIDCEADGNFNANPDAAADAVKDFSATGFRLGRAVHRGVLANCRATNNHSLGRHAPVAGFMLHSTSDVELRDCLASGNRSGSGLDANDGLAAGFLAAVVLHDNGAPVGGEANRFIDCVAEGNGIDAAASQLASPASMKGAGFLLRDQQQATLSGCRSVDNRGHGLWLQRCGALRVDDNRLAGNRGEDLRDDDPSAPRLIERNRSA